MVSQRNGSGGNPDALKALSDLFSPMPTSDAMESLNTIISEHLKAPKDVRNLLAFTSWPSQAHSQAAAMMTARGVSQLTAKEKVLFEKGELPLNRAPFPLKVVICLALNQISVDGRGRDDIVSAVTGFFIQNHGKNKGVMGDSGGGGGVNINIKDGEKS